MIYYISNVHFDAAKLGSVVYWVSYYRGHVLGTTKFGESVEFQVHLSSNDKEKVEKNVGYKLRESYL